jgi:hypothetical protein
MGLTDIDDYKKLVKSKTGVKISDKMARTDADLLTNSLVNSEMPIREMQDVKTTAYLNPRSHRGHAEVYGTNIMIGKQKKWETTVVPEHKIKVTEPSTTPIYNPKFWDWMIDHTDLGDSEIQSEEILNYTMGDDAPYDAYKGVDVHWHNSETGETVRGEDAIEKATHRTYGPLLYVADEDHPEKEWWDRPYNPEKHGPYDPNDPKFRIKSGKETLNATHLRDAGFIPNIFPGEGKSSKNVHVDKRLSIEKRWSTAQERPLEAKMHTRFVPGAVREETVPEEIVQKRVPYISQNTLVHEIGHQQDKRMDDPYSHRYRYRKDRSRYGGESMTYSSADPMEEGLADGYADRYTSSSTSSYHKGMGDMYEDVLHDPSDPTKAMTRTGYSVGFGGWKNDTHRALYAASRIASRTGDNGRNQYPSRHEIMKDMGLQKVSGREAGYLENRDHAELANQMALGHMLTTTPSLMKHLKGQGLDSVGRKARSAYIDAKRDQVRNKNGGWVQDPLPGFD